MDPVVICMEGFREVQQDDSGGDGGCYSGAKFLYDGKEGGLS